MSYIYKCCNSIDIIYMYIEYHYPVCLLKKHSIRPMFGTLFKQQCVFIALFRYKAILINVSS